MPKPYTSAFCTRSAFGTLATLPSAEVRDMPRVMTIAGFPATADLTRMKLSVERTAEQHHVNLISVRIDSSCLRLKFSGDEGKIVLSVICAQFISQRINSVTVIVNAKDMRRIDRVFEAEA